MRAYDAIQSAIWNARQSKNTTQQKQADELVDRYDKIVRGRISERPSTSLEQHPAASTEPIDPRQPPNFNLAQRGFSAGLPASKVGGAEEEVTKLKSDLATAKSKNQKQTIQAQIKALQDRIAISTGTERSSGDERLGHSGSTYVTVQILTPDGKKVIATLQARNRPDHDEHAEDVIMKQLESFPDPKKILANTKMVINGDQEVCERCAPRLQKFARDHDIAEVVGDTHHLFHG
jgi:hypothetical protein